MKYKVTVIDSRETCAMEIGLALLERGFEVAVIPGDLVEQSVREERSTDALVIRHRPPEVDAFKLSQVARRLFRIPIIVLGNKPEDNVYRETFDIEVDWDYYVSTPVNYDVLAARLRALLWRYGKRKLQDAFGD